MWSLCTCIPMCAHTYTHTHIQILIQSILREQGTYFVNETFLLISLIS